MVFFSRVFRYFLIIGLLGTFLSACAWFKPKEAAEVKAFPPVKVKKVFDPLTLRDGGKVVILPFLPGAGVEADEALDKMALMLIKGAAEVINAESAGLEVVLNEEAEEARFIVEGRFVSRKQASFFARFLFRKPRLAVSVEAKMIDRDSKKMILVYAQAFDTKDPKATLEGLAYQIGLDLGKYIDSILE